MCQNDEALFECYEADPGKSQRQQSVFPPSVFNQHAPQSSFFGNNHEASQRLHPVVVIRAAAIARLAGIAPSSVIPAHGMALHTQRLFVNRIAGAVCGGAVRRPGGVGLRAALVPAATSWTKQSLKISFAYLYPEPVLVK
jgi:hypothetical protein